MGLLCTACVTTFAPGHAQGLEPGKESHPSHKHACMFGLQDKPVEEAAEDRDLVAERTTLMAAQKSAITVRHCHSCMSENTNF